MTTNIAKVFLRLALAINGLAKNYTRDAYNTEDSDPRLPQFSVSDFYATKIDDICSLVTHENAEAKQPTDNNAYSDNIYGHLWFSKPATYEKVILDTSNI